MSEQGQCGKCKTSFTEMTHLDITHITHTTPCLLRSAGRYIENNLFY